MLLNGISIAAILWAAFCGVQDLIKLKVSNALTLGMVAVGLVALIVTRESLLGQSIGSALLGFLLAAFLTMPGYVLNKLGAADVKMLMAIGLISGLANTLETFVIGSLFAAGLMIMSRRLQGVEWFVNMTSSGPLMHLAPGVGKSFPFAICLAFGFIVAVVFKNPIFSY